jgi:hypothetical protein
LKRSIILSFLKKIKKQSRGANTISGSQRNIDAFSKNVSIIDAIKKSVTTLNGRLSFNAWCEANRIPTANIGKNKISLSFKMLKK